MESKEKAMAIRIVAVVLAIAWVGGAVSAQSSASFKLTESAFNSGGHPEDGTNPTSAGFAVTLGAIGDAVSPVPLSSASFRMEGSFVSGYPPPGEVVNLRFTSKTGLAWDAEKSTGDYNLYRSGSANAVDACFQSEIPGESATDGDSPAAGARFFYLVTAENRLGEEGTKGFRSNGTERGNPTPCP
jgi:hypothetical protein